MLILRRKVNDVVMIGEQITLRVIEIDGKQVRLAFDAPKDIQILRAELLAQQRPEGQETLS